MYYLTRFGDYNFLSQSGNYTDDVGSGSSFPSTTRTPDSWYDFRHATRAPRDLSPVSARKLVYASPCDASAADVYRDLRALRGTRARLFRTWKDVAYRQEWAWARLEDFDGVEQVRGRTSPLFVVSNLVFTMISPYWYGQGWGIPAYTQVPYYEGQELTVSQAATDVLIEATGVATFNKTITNRGNRDVLDVRVDLINGAVSSTNYAVQVTNITDTDNIHGWSYDATSATGNPIGPGNYVSVDGGRRTVREYGPGTTITNTFAEFLRVGANEQWLTLYPGDNAIRVVISGGAVSVDLDVQLSYFDAWE